MTTLQQVAELNCYVSGTVSHDGSQFVYRNIYGFQVFKCYTYDTLVNWLRHKGERVPVQEVSHTDLDKP